MVVVDVVIVGGGAAGIAAARRLASSGVSTLLLEAGARLGGRAHTRRSNGLPLDLGCGWLHSADRNPWVPIAEQSGRVVDRRTPAWGKQYHGLGFSPGDEQAARGALNAWITRLADAPPIGDRAADALPPDPRWHAYITAMAGFISGTGPERISAADFTNYDQAATGANWRVPDGYGSLIAASMPTMVRHRCGVAVRRMSFNAQGVCLDTDQGPVHARTAIATVSTAVLAGDALRLPPELDPWRDAAARLPLGRNEKLFLRVAAGAPFEDETQLLGDPHDTRSGAYYIRPFGWPVIECFLGGEGAEPVAREGVAAGLARSIDELTGLMGSSVRHYLTPIAASDWTADPLIGGAYSCALPGAAKERARLARPFEDRLFFAGEATSAIDFSTAHGAYATGQRAADEALAALRRRAAASPCR